MNLSFSKLLSIVAASGIASCAYSFTIVPTFDSSITSDPNGAAMMAAINAAIQVFQTNYTDNLTVKINYVSDPNAGLGASSTWGSEFLYASYVTALKSRASDSTDTNALTKLTNSLTDPVIGGTQIHLTSALARMLGLRSTYGPDGFDSTISLNMVLMNFTRPATNSNNYDLQAVVEHEMDEVLGSSSGLPNSPDVWPVDLFRYDTNLNRTFTTDGDNAYFSPDGTNLVARYNQQSDGSDYGDWWGGVGGGSYWAPPGVAAHPQVQDAYGTPGGFVDLGVSEITLLDVIGYTPVATNNTVSPQLVLKIVKSGAGQVTISWPTNFINYLLKERTNLTSGTWSTSVSGYNNPAIISTTSPQKFYELMYQAPIGTVVSGITQVQSPALSADVRVTHVLKPRGF